MDVRSIRATDEAALRALTLKLTPLRVRTQAERFVVWQTYGQYYLDCEAEHSLLAAQQDAIAGALMCAPSYTHYMRRFMEQIYPKCQSYGYNAKAAARQTTLLHKKIAGYYPAHLHCLWPESRQDIAGPLFDVLLPHLESIECRGICAFPDKKKQPALCETLDALGFKVREKVGSTLLMGKELF